MEKFVNSSEQAQTRIAFDLAKKGAERTDLEQKLFIEYRKILDARLNATEDEQEAEIGLTQKGIDDKIAAEKKREEEHIKSIEKQKKLEQELWEANSKILQQRAKEEKEYRDNKLASEKKLSEDRLSLEEGFWVKARAFLKKVEDEEKEKADKKKRDDEDIANAGIQLITDANNAIFDYQTQKAQIEEQRAEEQAEREKERIQDLVDNEVITSEEGARQIEGIDKTLDNKKKEFAKAQASRDKAQALFNIAIDTIVASIKALPNTVLSGIIVALGAVAATAVIAKPIPEFADGVIDLKGGVRGKDSIPALLMPGESVMTTEETQRHGELLRSIRSKKLDEYIMDNYLNPKLSTLLSNSTAENIAKSAKINGLNEYSLSRVMSRNKGVNVQNADYIAKAIAREMRSDNVKRTWSA